MILLLSALLLAAPDVQTAKHRVTGLFSREREEDLREAMKSIADVALVSIDFDVAEATFSYDPAKICQKKNPTPKEVLERLDNLLKQSSRHTFGAAPLCETPREKLTRVEIGVLGLDCKGCALGAYESISKIEGVAQATVSFKESLLTALIDPSKTSREALIDALKKRQVKLKP